MAGFEDLRRAVAEFYKGPPRLDEMPSIKCGSFKRLCAAIEQQTGREVKEPSSQEITSMMFGGVRVFEHSYLPENTIVLMKGKEIAAIINLKDTADAAHGR